MSLTSRIQRSSGTVYGEMMESSGITLPNGTYITGNTLATQLMDAGLRVDRLELLRDESKSPGYGPSDNILTGVQFLYRDINRKHEITGFSKYFYNRWKEAMSGNDLDIIPDLLGIKHYGKRIDPFKVMVENPREGVEILQKMFNLITGPAGQYMDQFLGQIDANPCTIYGDINSPGGKISRIIKSNGIVSSFLGYDVVGEMMQSVSKEDRWALDYVISLLLVHNLCANKADVLKPQIEELVSYDTSKIPTEWQERTLEEAVITAERLVELEEMFQNVN